MIDEYKAPIEVCIIKQIVVRDVRWQASKPPFIKINTDIGFNALTSEINLGVVIKNCSGDLSKCYEQYRRS